MTFCAQHTDGPDICEPFGTSSEGHGPDPLAPGCWVGIHQRQNFGLLELYGCDEGCFAAPDNPDELLDQQWVTGGNRWMRPAGMARDARGVLHDLRSGESHPFNRVGGRYEKAACYQQNDDADAHIECFGVSPCSCFPGDPFIATDGACAGTPLGGLMTGSRYPDAFTYVGSGWHNDLLNCRNFREFGTITIGVGPRVVEGMLMPVAVRSNAVTGPASGNTNALILCLSQAKGTPDCLGNWLNDPTHDPLNPPLYYNEDAVSRTRLGRLFVVSNTMRLETGGAFPFAQKTSLILKDRFLRDTLGRSLVDSPDGAPRIFTDLNLVRPDNPQFPTQWEKTFNGGRNCSITLGQDATLLGTFPNCRMSSGDSITMQARVHYAKLSAIFIVEKHAGRSDGAVVFNDFEFHGRVRMDIEVSWTAEHGDHGITNPPDCFDLPVPPLGQRIIYRDDEGRKFTPPRHVSWLGYLGRRADGGTERQEVQLGTVNGSCREIARTISNVPVRGWPVLADAHPQSPAQLYKGEILFRMDQ